MMHNEPVRTSVTLDDDVYELASTYAAARRITLGAAIVIRMSPQGIPILSSRGGPMTMELVKTLQDDEID